MRYGFASFICQVGGKFACPDDKDAVDYRYPLGFDDAFADAPDLPFPSFL